MGKLTKRQVERAAPREKRYQLADGDGLCLWVYPNGRKAWITRYRRPGDGRQDYYTHPDPWPDHDAEAARARNQEIKALLRNGIDPKAHAAAQVAKESSEPTMSELVDKWLAHLTHAGEITERSIKAHRWRWEAYLRRHLGALRLKDVTRGHLAAALDYARTRAKEETRKALSTLNLALDYALARHLIDMNPARVLRPKDFACTASKGRKRVLSLQELRELWAAIDTASDPASCGSIAEGGSGKPRTAALHMATAAALKFAILTGARRAEIAGLPWSEVDLDAQTWTLPPERTKNRNGHTVYLSRQAADLLHDLELLNGAGAWAFSTTDPEHPLHPDSLTTALDRIRRAMLPDLEHFTFHDLRRTAATCWAEHLDVRPDVIELMLNHVPADKLRATYQRQKHVAKQREAWRLWGELIEHQIMRDPGNVVPIGSAAYV